MQPGVDRHRDQARKPRAVEHFEIFGAVPHDHGDPLSALQAHALTQRTGDARGALGESAIVADEPIAVINRGGCRKHAGRADQELCKIHRCLP